MAYQGRREAYQDRDHKLDVGKVDGIGWDRWVASLHKVAMTPPIPFAMPPRDYRGQLVTTLSER